MRIVFVGLGGVGSEAVDKISQFLNYKENLKDSTVVLIDGDDYEPKNLDRQQFVEFINKAVSKRKELSNIYLDLKFEAVDDYLTEDNIHYLLKDQDVIFLAVDCMKTRKIVSHYCEEKLNNVVLISGGNEFYDGNVQIFIRKEGKSVTPNLTKYHPEIEEANNKTKSELSCEELMGASDPQLLFVNATAAIFMCQAFYNAVILDKCEACDIYFDMKMMAASAKIRK